MSDWDKLIDLLSRWGITATVRHAQGGDQADALLLHFFGGPDVVIEADLTETDGEPILVLKAEE